MAKLCKEVIQLWNNLSPEKSRKAEINFKEASENLDNVPNVKPQKGLVALIIGHNEKYQGAINYLDESEYNFSKRILAKVQIRLSEHGYRSVVITRPPVKSYATQVEYVADKCQSLGVTHAILSHFNSAGKTARGCEFLVPDNRYVVDNKMADMATDLLNTRLGIKERRNDGVYEVDKSHNGSGMLYALDNHEIMSTLAEPAFATYRTVESAAIFEDEDAYVRILAEVAIACSNGSINFYQG